jgi:dihydrofolate synthase / folylpolyglutamate synthase
MTYEQAMHFWFGRINYEVKAPRPSDLTLDRMRDLLTLLDNPQNRYRIVHVAGSKGKGSTSAILASILGRAGYRTGLFTSPHLCAVEERIQVDRTPITADELTRLMDEIQSLASRHGLEPALTFFEIATALGFLHFARRQVDVAVVEVGLGGRFDSTNVCAPLVSIITSISFDHTQYLGNTLAQIAMEKAGIVKPGRPCLSGVQGQEAREVIEDVCRQRAAPLKEIERDFHYRQEPAMIGDKNDTLMRVMVTSKRSWPPLEVNLIGEHQAANAALAVAAVEEIVAQGLPVSDQAVANGLARVDWPARLEIMGRQPLVLLDCAHNVASAEALVRSLQTSLPRRALGGRRYLIFAGSNDKDLAGMLRVLAPQFDHVALTRFAQSPRSVAPEELAKLVPNDIPRSNYASAAAAWNAVRRQASAQDMICVTGSVFLAGELRPVMLANLSDS